MRVTTLNDRLFFATGYIEAEAADGRSWTATGFVCGVDDDGHRYPFLVTNKHVVEGAARLTVRFIKSDGTGSPQLGAATQITMNAAAGRADWWIGHPDDRVDVAVIPLAQVIDQMAQNGAPPFYAMVPISATPTVDQIAGLDSVEEVTFVGYPAGLFDKVNFLPIIRRGHSATPIEVDYEGLPAFLIDASVFPGSSGSPVFIANAGPFSGPDGSLSFGSRLFLLGVLGAVHQHSILGQIVQVPTTHVAVVPETLDLGIVFKGSAIHTCMKLALDRAGHEGLL